MKRSSWVATFAAMLISLSVHAHSVHIFVSHHDDTVLGRVMFNDHEVAVDVPVTLLDDTNKTIGNVQTGSSGRFYFIVPGPGTYRVVAETTDGHRAEEILAITKASFEGHVDESSGDSGDAVSLRMDEMLERMDQLEHRTGLRDILGGIGYVLGFLGLLALLKQRRNA